MTIVKSAKGVDVDFDLLRMKEQLQTAPSSKLSETRKQAVSARKRRGSSKVLQKLIDQLPKSPVVEERHADVEDIDTSLAESKKPKLSIKKVSTGDSVE